MFHFEGEVTKKKSKHLAVSEIIYYFAPDLHIQSQKFIANNEFHDKNNLLPRSLRLKNFIRV